MQWWCCRWWWWRWGRVWLAGWAGGVQGELWGGAASPAEIRFWQSEVRSVCKITGEVTDPHYFLICKILTAFLSVIRQSNLTDVFEVKMMKHDLMRWHCPDRRNWATWLMWRTQKEQQQQRGGWAGWKQRRLLFLLTITCEFIKVIPPPTPPPPGCLLSADIHVSLQGWFVWGWWDKEAAEI